MSATTKTLTVLHAEPQPAEASLLTQIMDHMTALATQGPRVSPIGINTFAELEKFAERAARSGMVPNTFSGKPDAIIIAVQMGSELGLAPMQSLQCIAVVNGRPSVWGDAIPGLCKASAFFDDIVETMEGSGDQMTAVCSAKRKGKQPSIQRFSVADAKRAGLWGKAGPWTQYPQRMLQMRARSFACRDAFPDVLKGLRAAEEAFDTPADVADDFRRSFGTTSIAEHDAANEAIPLAEPAAP
ncbi:MAG: hypothetical protein KGL35_14085, partial [Bradyrhizobium sp.]|nr:hypothetical protein [Bradyrhizobium sp.]